MLRYILLGLLGLLLLLLFAPVKAEFLWRREVLSLRLRLLWLIPVAILPAKEKEPEQDKPPKAKKAKKKKPPKPQPPKAPPPPKKGPVQKALEVLQLVNDLLPHLTASAGYILRRVTLSRCRVALVVSEEEADQVGIACGRAYAVGYAAQSGLRGVLRVKEFIFNVLPDFVTGQEAADAEVTLEARPSTLLAGGVLLLWRAAKTMLAQKTAKPSQINE